MTDKAPAAPISMLAVQELAAHYRGLASDSSGRYAQLAAALEALVRLVEAVSAVRELQGVHEGWLDEYLDHEAKMGAALAELQAALAQFTDDREAKP